MLKLFRARALSQRYGAAGGLFATAVAAAARGITERSDACGSSHRMGLPRGRCVATLLKAEFKLFVHSAVGLECVLASWIM